MATFTTTLPSQRIYPGATITLPTVVKVSGVDTDAAGIIFKWKEGAFGEDKSITPTRTATGTYEVSITPSRSGNIYFRWDTEGALDSVEEGVLSVARSRFRV